MTLDLKALQRHLGVNADGDFGRTSCTALFVKCGAGVPIAEEMGLAAAVLFPQYGVLDSIQRLAHFMAQLAHESGGFHYMEEIWGPTDAQRGYEGRTDLGNTAPGDGTLFKGRGPIQITGRANYRRFGRIIGIDIERHPELAAVPSIGLHLALAFWDDRKLNALADANDCAGITHRINGGENGFADRVARLEKIRDMLQ